MRTAQLINDIINGIERLVRNIQKLYTNIKTSLKTKKNITV